MSGVAPPRRKYDSELRRRRAGETRDRIVAAGASILHEHPVWNWDALTHRAVAARAGVHERTVYRYFENERLLRDAVLERLERESGVDVGELTIDTLRAFARQLLGYVSAFPVQSRTTLDPTLAEAGDRKRAALLAAVAGATPAWDDEARRIAAATIDVLWSVGTHERLVSEWGLDAGAAVTAVTWAIALVEGEIRDDRPPVS